MILSMQHIFKEYTQGKMSVPVLRDICLEVDQGDYVAIMGPSGSGKTTLMNIIGCLDLPSSGAYLFNNRDITTRTNDQLAVIRNKHIGFVFQNFYLLPNYSALDNVALPLAYANVPKAERIERAKEALRIVGLEDRVKFRPNQLSGGQCQRVAIARAIVSHPQLLLADEPTGALDSASGDQIMEIFDQLNAEGVTILMITHELAIAQRAHTIYHLLDGELNDAEGNRIQGRDDTPVGSSYSYDAVPEDEPDAYDEEAPADDEAYDEEAPADDEAYDEEAPVDDDSYGEEIPEPPTFETYEYDVQDEQVPEPPTADDEDQPDAYDEQVPEQTEPWPDDTERTWLGDE